MAWLQRGEPGFFAAHQRTNSEEYMTSRKWIVQVLCLLLATPSFADFRYEETTRITGGAIVGMMKLASAFNRDAKQTMAPTTSTVLVKGDRMARINPDRTEIIDLDKETITNIDHRKKQYTVMTFQEMKERMEEAQKRAAEQQAKSKPSQAPANNTPPPKMDFKVSVKDTGATKRVAGLDAKEAILCMTMEATDQKTGDKGSFAMTNDMWMVPEIPGYGEVRDFNRRLALKMGMIYGDALKPAMGSMRPGSAQGMTEMAKEMSKLKGVPVLQVMRVGASPDGQPLPAASEAPLPQSNSPSSGEVAQKSATSAIVGKLSPFGGFGRKQKNDSQDAPPPQGQPQGAPNASASVLVESSIETSSFSSAPIDPAQFNVPAGYAQVAFDAGRAR